MENLYPKHGLVSRTYYKKSLIMASTFGSKSKFFMTISIPSQDKPLTNRPVPVKAIDFPQDVPSTSDRRLIELKNQVQRLMEAHLSLTQPPQVNKITTSYEICSGPHDTHYYMEDPEQAFVEYASSRIDEAGVPPSSNTELVCTKEEDGDVMFIEIVSKDENSCKEEPKAGEQEVEYFDIFPTRSELAYHKLSQVVLGNVEITNMTHDPPEGVVRFTNRNDEVAYKMPHKIEQYNSLSNLEKEHTKSVYLRNEDDKRRGVDIWKAFGGNTRDLGSFGEKRDKNTDLHQHLSRISTQRLETASQITRDAVITHTKTASQDLKMAAGSSLLVLKKHTMKVKESLNMTFDESHSLLKTSPLKDDDLVEEEAIKVSKKKPLGNDVEDEVIEVDEIVNLRESKSHPLENVIRNLN
uniref:MAK10-like protein n=1 Tax=Tanacetum cinerariifolium TaxID=118510 RepID=A0A6L2M919_TANCI|nr:MAK10-like protein [Tanacetum cinerariifolium]